MIATWSLDATEIFSHCSSSFCFRFSGNHWTFQAHKLYVLESASQEFMSIILKLTLSILLAAKQGFSSLERMKKHSDSGWYFGILGSISVGP